MFRVFINRRMSRKLTGVLILVWLRFGSIAAAQEAKLPSHQRQQVEEIITKFMAANSVAGLAAAIVVRDGEAWSEGFGMADLENSVPVTPHTLFRLGSVSKAITATAAMQLWEQGKLVLDAPIQNYCPAFPQKEWPITTRQLLGHLGGIRHYRSDNDEEVNNTKHFDDPIAGGLQFFASDPLIARPGTKFSYSTQGFTLVGCAIEGASHEKYVDYVVANIFRPAHMTESRWDDRYAIVPHRTRFYSKSKTGGVVNADFLDASYKIPGGGWLSSADDMASFETAILRDALVKHSTREVMWTPQQPSTPEVSNEKHRGYALGWGTGNSAGVPDVGHGGSQQGTSTFIVLAPAQQIGIVVLINMDGVDASALGANLMKVLVGEAAKDQQVPGS